MTTSRETHLVELVDPEGAPAGSATVSDAHRAPGQLHRAFSVFLRDPSGRVLLQQRAAVKTRFPLRWANTCCGHPRPGETPATAAARRLVEEVGVEDVALIEVGVYSYYAEDPTTGLVEYEYDHVLLGDVPADTRLLVDPDEVAEVRWTSVDELSAGLREDLRSYAPWLPGVTERLIRHLALGPQTTAADVPRSADDAPERSGGR
ncbi:isopentenyl-diphosphate Delta-isomerase [Amorphoplanes nipponensis]|uniref:Isopentenyl-diphosphate Delta-isomerase n=1 Tax=Actinoplanes nipponensis TaxID=135950 RepID=A0A919JUZ6_9ACTN|nr:isopentenyl-diphosphate Delta-isomerase [Actinoplanes nipponensis]GIE53484.1 isopentenyl-diphosphate Delta-isomerase [Actinoplanes nipponensis]